MADPTNPTWAPSWAPSSGKSKTAPAKKASTAAPKAANVKNDSAYTAFRDAFIEDKLQESDAYFDAFVWKSIPGAIDPSENIWKKFVDKAKAPDSGLSEDYANENKEKILENIKAFALIRILERRQLIACAKEALEKYEIKKTDGSVQKFDKTKWDPLLRKMSNDGLEKLSKEKNRQFTLLKGLGEAKGDEKIVQVAFADLDAAKINLPEEEKQDVAKQYFNLVHDKSTTITDIIEFIKNLDPDLQKTLMRYYYQPIALRDLPETSGNNWDMGMFIVQIAKKHLINVPDDQIKDLANNPEMRKRLGALTISFADLLHGPATAEEILKWSTIPELAAEDMRLFLASLQAAPKKATTSPMTISDDILHRTFVGIEKAKFKYISKIENLVDEGSVIHLRPKLGSKQLYLLDKVDQRLDQKTGVILRNITGPLGGVQLKGEEEFVSYQDLDSLFDLTKKAGGSCSIQSSDDFRLKLEGGAIKDVVDPEDMKSLNALCDRIDLDDVPGKKMGVKEGTCFTFWQDGRKGIVRILEATDTGIKLTNSNDTSFSLAEFYASFIRSNGKRVTNMTDLKTLLVGLQAHADGKVKNGFAKLEVKDEKLISKEDNGRTNPRAVQYFVNKGNGEAIFVEETRWTQIKCRRGKWTAAKDNNPPRFEAKSRTDWINIENFYLNISELSLEPEILLDAQEISEKTNTQDIQWTGTIFQRWMSGTSINSMMKGSKQMLNAFKASMEEGSSLNAARVALSFAKWLPDGVAAQLQSTVKAEQKKLRDGFIGRIKSPKQASKILLNKSAPDFQVKAALLYVLKEHGSLYPDDDFKWVSDKFAWYERFWGSRKDPLFIAEMQKCATAVNEKGEHDPKPFLEENLLLEYFKKLEKEKKTGEYFFIDFRSAMAEGYKKAKDEGEKKIEGEFRMEEKKNILMKEIEANKSQWAMGALGKIMDAGGSDVDMYGLTFIFTMTGLTQKMDEANVKEYVMGKTKKFPYTPLLFGRTMGDISLFRRVTVSLAETISQDAKKMAEKAIDDPTGKAAKEFWGMYGEKMTPKYMCGISDPEIFLKKETNPDYKAYYDRVGKNLPMLGIDETVTRIGMYNHDRNSMLLFDKEKYLGKFWFSFGQDKSFRTEVMGKIFDESLAQLDDLKNSDLDTDAKKAIYKHIYIAMATAMSNALSGNFKDKMEYAPCEKLMKYGMEIVYPKNDSALYSEKGFEVYIDSGYEYFMGKNTDNETRLVRKKVSEILQENRTNPPAWRVA